MTIGKRRRGRTAAGERPAVREMPPEEIPVEEHLPEECPQVPAEASPAEEIPAEASPAEEPRAEVVPAEEAPDGQRAQLAREREDFEREKAEFARQQMTFAVEQELQRRGLPVEFAPWLAGETPEEAAERVDAFELRFQEAVSAAVTRRMRGQGAPREPHRARGYSREELRNLSRREINAHWEEIQRTLKH